MGPSASAVRNSMRRLRCELTKAFRDAADSINRSISARRAGQRQRHSDHGLHSGGYSVVGFRVGYRARLLCQGNGPACGEGVM